MDTKDVNDKQEGGDHYKNTIGLQLWDFIDDNNIPFLEANVLKYVIRYKHKNGLQDLEKAAHYLEKIISQQEKKKRFTNYDELDFVKIVGAYDLDGDQIDICKAVIENRYPAAQCILQNMIQVKLRRCVSRQHSAAQDVLQNGIQEGGNNMVTLRDVDASTLGLIWDNLSDDEREMIRSISFGEVMEELSVKEKAVAALVWAYHKNLPVRTLIEMTIACIKKVDNKTKDTPCKQLV